MLKEYKRKTAYGLSGNEIGKIRRFSLFAVMQDKTAGRAFEDFKRKARKSRAEFLVFCVGKTEDKAAVSANGGKIKTKGEKK